MSPLFDFRCSDCGGPLGHYPVGAEAGDEFQCVKCIKEENTQLEKDEKTRQGLEAIDEKDYQEDLQEEAQVDTPQELPQEMAEPQLAGSPLDRKFTRLRKEVEKTTRRRERGEYDPAEDEQDKEVHFSTVQYDPDLSNTAKPTGAEHISLGQERIGAQKDESDHTLTTGLGRGETYTPAEAAQIIGGKGKSSIKKRKAGPRDMPSWVETDEGIEKFFAERERVSGDARDLDDERLEKLILVAYYRERFKDREIFVEYEGLFMGERYANPIL